MAKFSIEAQIQSVEAARDRLNRQDKAFEYEHARISAALDTLRFCRDNREAIIRARKEVSND